MPRFLLLLRAGGVIAAAADQTQTCVPWDMQLHSSQGPKKDLGRSVPKAEVGKPSYSAP